MKPSRLLMLKIFLIVFFFLKKSIVLHLMCTNMSRWNESSRHEKKKKCINDQISHYFAVCLFITCKFASPWFPSKTQKDFSFIVEMACLLSAIWSGCLVRVFLVPSMEVKCNICWIFSSWASKAVKMYIRSFSGRRENVTVEAEEWYTSTEIFKLLAEWFGETYHCRLESAGFKV